MKSSIFSVTLGFVLEFLLLEGGGAVMEAEHRKRVRSWYILFLQGYLILF